VKGVPCALGPGIMSLGTSDGVRPGLDSPHTPYLDYNHNCDLPSPHSPHLNCHAVKDPADRFDQTPRLYTTIRLPT
jgi:hypothetical protein